LKWLFDIYTVEQTFPSPLVSVATSAADASGTGSGRVPRRGVGRPRVLVAQGFDFLRHHPATPARGGDVP